VLEKENSEAFTCRRQKTAARTPFEKGVNKVLVVRRLHDFVGARNKLLTIKSNDKEERKKKRGVGRGRTWGWIIGR